MLRQYHEWTGPHYLAVVQGQLYPLEVGLQVPELRQ